MKKVNWNIQFNLFVCMLSVVLSLNAPSVCASTAAMVMELPGAVDAGQGTVTTVKGVVKFNGTPLDKIWVQIATTRTRTGDGENEAQIGETLTDAEGRFSIRLNINGPGDKEYGMLKLFSNEYYQNAFEGVYGIAGGKIYDLGVVAMGKLSDTDKFPGAAGFRTSWYGLKNNGGLPKLECMMSSMIDFNKRQKDYLSSVPMIYLTVTQTEPYKGQSWGKTYLLWKNTGNALGAPFEYVPASEMKFDFHAVIRYINQNHPNTLVFLQLEPGFVDLGNETMENLLKEVLDEFVGSGTSKIHDIAGIGIDAEWYRFCEDMEDKNPPPSKLKPNIISAEKAQRWERIVRGYGIDKMLFLKHFTNRANNYWADPPNDNCDNPEHGKPFDDYLPSLAYGSTLFINDSQDFDWDDNGCNGDPNNCLDRMVEDFTKWVTYYNHGQSITNYIDVRYYDPCKPGGEDWVYVTNDNPKPRYHGFQIGYLNDQVWWKSYGEKGALTKIPKTLIDKFRIQYPGLAFGFYWVDFTLRHEYVYKEEMECR